MSRKLVLLVLRVTILESYKEFETVALIVSAGRGRRFGKEIPKQYFSIGDDTILMKTVRAFANHQRVDAVRVVIRPEDVNLYKLALGKMKILEPAYGGLERQDSVREGLESLKSFNPTNVLIHDSVRPFVSSATIDRVLDIVTDGRCCIPGLPLSDALKSVDNGRVVDNLERSGVWRIQTPQGFPYKKILDAHRALIGRNLPDDAAVADAFGLSVEVVRGGAENEKITNIEDLEGVMDQLALQEPGIRVGNGYDVHRFTTGEFVTLCGVKVPHNRSLLGHSDADVGLHALTDAMLGAIGKGDIGEYFPSSDEEWKNADSEIFLRHAGDAVRSLGGKVQNLDITIICEAPKIRPYRDEMINKICEILSISPSRVNVKGTTNDKLGFIGRNEGVAAQATAVILLKQDNNFLSSYI